MHKRAMLALTCALSAGCDPNLPNPCDQLGSGTDCQQTATFEACLESRFSSDPTAEAAVTLLDIPQALQSVLDNSAAYSQDDNPLAATQPGVIVDILGDVNGCWGRVEDEQFSDESGQWKEAAALDVDLSAGTITQQRMIGVDGFDCASDDRPSIMIFEQEITDATDGQFTVTIVGDLENDRTTAGLNDDGSLSFHLRARTGWEASVGNTFTKTYSVNGDFLVTNRTSGGAAEGEVDLWKRLPCPN